MDLVTGIGEAGEEAETTVGEAIPGIAEMAAAKCTHFLHLLGKILRHSLIAGNRRAVNENCSVQRWDLDLRSEERVHSWKLRLPEEAREQGSSQLVTDV